MPALDISKIPQEDRIRAMEELAARRGLKLPPSVKARVLSEEAGRRGLLTYKSFGEFVQVRKPELLRHDYMRRAIAVADRVLHGEIPRLLVLEPTQYGKSELWSRLLPAYYLLKNPSHTVGLASYGADLAWELSGEARAYYAESGGTFRIGSSQGSSRNWRTARRSGSSGGMWATGIGGPALGRGYHLGIVDDPVDPEQATRAPYQRRFARWWPAKWLRGQRPGGAIIIFVMQRLAIDDPANWLLEREDGRAEEKWHILAMDELHSEEPYWKGKGDRGFPKSCTVEPDPRKVGEVLAPEWRSLPEVLRIQAQTGSVISSAMRQQRPMRPTGDFWQEKWFKERTYKALPADAYNGGWDWDTAYTKDEHNSGTAGVLSYRGAGDKETFKIYIHDAILDYLEFPELIKLMSSLKNAPHFVEKKASGKSIVQQLLTYQIVATEVLVLGDKLARASAVQPAASTGRIYISELIYDRLMAGDQGLLRVQAEALQEGSIALDLNDAFVQGLHRHLGIGAEVKKKVQFM